MRPGQLLHRVDLVFLALVVQRQVLVGSLGRAAQLQSGGALRDIAPTLLAMMGLPQPAEMTGRSLIQFQ